MTTPGWINAPLFLADLSIRVGLCGLAIDGYVVLSLCGGQPPDMPGIRWRDHAF